MLKKQLLLSAAITALATSAMATDLPSRVRAPVFAPPPAVVEVDTTGFYAGINAGGNYSVNTEKFEGNIGAKAGYDFGMVRLEGTYDHFGFDRGTSAFQGNAILQYRLGDFTPYLLAGGGLAVLDKDLRFSDSLAIYNVGGGVRYSLAQFGLPKADIDLRYRHLGSAQFQHYNKDIVTVGFGYGF